MTRTASMPAAPRAQRIAIGGAGVVLWLVALFLPQLRNAEGALATPFAFVSSVAACVVFVGVLWGRIEARALAYGALFFIGSAAQLQLAQMGPNVAYQHLYELRDLAAGKAVYAVAVVALQAACVLFGARGTLARALAGLRARTGTVGLLAILAAFALTSATLSKDVVRYAIELGMATVLQTISVANLLLAAAALGEGTLARADAGLSRFDGRRAPAGKLDPVALWGAGWVLLVTVALNIFSYERFPHVPDEVVYLYHARYLAEGLPWVDLPAVPRAFHVDLMFFDYAGGRMWSPVPLGWPLVLSVGAAVGLPFLVNPLLASVCLLLAFGFTRRVLGLPSARLLVLLMATSPWFLFLAMSFMTHTASLFGALLAAYCVARVRDGGRVWWGLLGGAGIGLVSLVRPLEGMAVAVTLGLWMLTFRPLTRALIGDTLMGLSTIAVGAVTLPYNKMLTGDPTYAPIMHYTDVMYGNDSNALGFGPNRGLGWSSLDPFPGHGAIDVAINSNLNAYAINVELFGWTTGSLGLIALLWFSRGMRRFDWALTAAAALIVVLHAFYWFAGGPDFGARYWYMAFMPLQLLGVRAVEWLMDAVADGRTRPDSERTRVKLAVLLLCATTVLSFLPWRAIDKYYHYRGMRPGLRSLMAELAPGRSLIVVRGRRHPELASAFALNPVDFNAQAPLFAWDKTPELTRELLEAYKDLPVYIVDGPTVTGADFALALGPVEKDAALAYLASHPMETE